MSDDEAPRRVVKLGGSLLSWHDWATAFREWHRNQSPANDILIVGGGDHVNQLRVLDQRIGLGQTVCHQIAIDMMTVNALRVAHKLDIPVASSCDQNGLYILNVERFVTKQTLTDNRGQPLPSHWDVTSDSLAAAIARQCNATELVLLKSTDPPNNWTTTSFVDPIFRSTVSPHLKTRVLNLRDLPVGQAASLSPPTIKHKQTS